MTTKMDGDSINRIRLEFKASGPPVIFISSRSINRIRLEFKEYGKVQVGEVTMSVLIESDWNLKLTGTAIAVKGASY